jgi:hypothetical protein
MQRLQKMACQRIKMDTMRNQLIKLVCLACVVVLGAFQCVEKEEAARPDDMVTVRVSFVASICGDAICKIEDSEYAYLGAQGFTFQGRTYDGVFTTILPCPSAGVTEAMNTANTGDIFTVMISKAPFPGNNDCARCMATFSEAPPSVFYHIRPVAAVR